MKESDSQEEDKDEEERLEEEGEETEGGELIQSFDDILHHVGDWGRFQFTLLVFFFFFCLFNSYVVYTPILFLHLPDHWCSPHPSFLQVLPNGSSSSSRLDQEEILDQTVPLEESGKRRSQCMMYNRTLGEISHPEESLEGKIWEQVPCQYGWKYNYTGYFTSAATEMNWVCEDRWKGPFTQSVFFIGGIFGTLIFGYTADHFGRYPTFLTQGTLLFATGIMTPFCNNFVSFTVIRFLMGLTFDTTIQTFYLLAFEYVAIDKRSLVGNLSFALGFSLGGCYESWLLKYLQDWKIFHHILFAQTALIFAAPWFLHESVRWLAAEGKVDECVRVLKSIGKTNGKRVSKEALLSFQRMLHKQYLEESQDASRRRLTWKDLFLRPRLRRRSLLVIATFMTIAGLFDGHVRNISNLSSSLYLTFTLAAALELPADLLVIWGIDRIGRRGSMFFSLAMSGISMLLCGFCKDTALTVFSMIGRFWITYAMNTGQQYVFEVFPTTLRAQGNALASVFSLGSQFFSPYVVHSSVITPSLPFVILGLGGFVGALMSVWLPETAGVELPNTIEEAEEFGRNQPLSLFPMKRKKKKDSKMSINNNSDDGVVT